MEDRHLAAVMMADVVGYSRLMEADEAGTLAVLRRRWEALLEPIVASHRGRVVKLMGDGVLTEFTSAVNAVAAALELQRGMAEANATLPEDRRLMLRIGINLGDVIVDGADIYGEGVNVAARLQTLARPGGVCISSKIFEEVRGKVTCPIEDMGEQSVKNISRPIRTYLLDPEGSEQTQAAVAEPEPPALPDKPSIAVLPFQNMSGDLEQEYFADGMVEDIITALSRNRWLFVIARNSSFTYKGRAVDVKEVGRQLGVRYVLEGSVRRAGQRLRITAQLIDAATGAHLWADRFDGDLADVFDLQDQVTASVVGTIAPRLEQAEIERVKRKPTESLDAYDHYLRGMAAFHQFTREANLAALDHFTRAFERDPEFAAAYGMAARCYVQRKGFGWQGNREQESAEARRLARIAAERGRDDAIASAAAGFALVYFGDISDGIAYIERGLQLNPNLAWAWHILGFAKAMLGTGGAIEDGMHAMRLSPQDPQMFAMQGIIGLGHFLEGRYEEALGWGEAVQRTQSRFLIGHGLVAASAALLGQQARAESAMQRLREIDPELRHSNLRDWLVFVRGDDFERWSDGLRRAGLPQ